MVTNLQSQLVTHMPTHNVPRHSWVVAGDLQGYRKRNQLKTYFWIHYEIRANFAKETILETAVYFREKITLTKII